MKKVFLFSLFLVLGLVLSQCLPVWLGEAFLTAEKVAKTLMFVCLAFIMINVGREFELDKTKWRSYAADYFIAMATAAVPWIMVAFYYMFLLPADLFGNWDAWKENLLLSRFAAPTSAGILFTMLAAAGLRREWIYKKTQVLAIFDDLDTILLMIPLQIFMIGFICRGDCDHFFISDRLEKTGNDPVVPNLEIYFILCCMYRSCNGKYLSFDQVDDGS